MTSRNHRTLPGAPSRWVLAIALAAVSALALAAMLTVAAALVAMLALAHPAGASDREILAAAGPAPNPAAPGPFEAATAEVVVPRPDGTTFAASLHYPLPGSSSDPAHMAQPAPIVAFGHGYQTPVDLYSETLDHLASWGIVVVAPRSGGGLFPSHQSFADDLRVALDWVAAEAAEGGDWPTGPVDSVARGVFGHSMGGGAAVLAAAGDPTIRAVATLAAAETDPSAIAAAARLGAPSLFIAAGDDAITPVAAHQRPMFEATRTGRAQLRTIVGGGHCGFLDSEGLLLRLFCDEATIEREEQLATTRAILATWLRHELAADEALDGVAWPDEPDGWTEVETG